MDDYRSRLQRVCERVARAEAAAGRAPGSVTVLLATKTQPAEVIAEVFAIPEAAGMLRGENRVQELVAKGPQLVGLDLSNHLIGPLQSNKINHALAWVDTVESVASIELARGLSTRLEPGRELAVMIQVNVSGEATKSGVVPSQAVELAAAVAELPQLRLTGFMTIGAHTDDERVVRAGYGHLARLRDAAVDAGLTSAIELSMGMSNDLELAIAEGATIVRIGTAVFGARTYPV